MAAGQVVLVVWLISAFIGALIGSSKGRALAGLVLGLILGVIGLIIVVFLPAKGGRAAVATQAPRACPWCAEAIQRDALVCKHCGRDAPRLPDPGGFDPLPQPTWFADPSGRHPDRYWDGANWTKWVRDQPGGTRAEDPAIP